MADTKMAIKFSADVVGNLDALVLVLAERHKGVKWNRTTAAHLAITRGISAEIDDAKAKAMISKPARKRARAK